MTDDKFLEGLHRLLSQGAEVDFLASFPNRRRALRTLQEPIGAAAQARVISLDRMQPSREWPEAVIWSSALEWLLQA